MNSINSKIERFENYLSGFDDLYKHESVGKTVCGFLKVASYFVTALVLPAIAGYALYLAKGEAKQRKDLMERVNATIDNEKTQAVSGVAIQILKPASQDDFIKFLLMKIEDNDLGEAYQKAFKKLELPSQESFFLKLIEINKLRVALEALPTDIKELRFSCGTHLDEGDKSAENAKLFISQLSHFTDLDKVEVNFSAIGCFTRPCRDYLNGIVNLMKNFQRVSKHNNWSEAEYIRISGRSFCGNFSYLHTNRLDLVKETVQELLLGLKNKQFKTNSLRITHNDLNDGYDYGSRHDIIVEQEADKNSYAIKYGNASGKDGSNYSFNSTTFKVAEV
ncbi:MAG: hypothetical protein ACHQUC_10120 [Chlamydiales bacterium]